MCGIKTTFIITQGCMSHSVWKTNSSHLKNFTPTSQLMQLTIFRYDFRKPQDQSFLMVLSRKNFPLQKCRGEGNLAKKRRFSCQHQKNSSGCQSDNFDPRRSAYGSSESLCLKFFRTPVKKVINFKIVGESLLQSQVILICVTQNRCFLGTFF